MLRVQRWDAVRDGVLTAARLRERLEAQGLWVTERRFAPGTSCVLPAVDYDVLHVVLSGVLQVTVGPETATLGTGDTLFVPAGADARVEATGTTATVAFAGAFLPHGPSGPSGTRMPSAP